MPFFQSGDDWLRESLLLVQARPTTTKVATRYNHAKPLNQARRRSEARRKDNKPASEDAGKDSSTPTPQAYGMLVLRTYDPISGVCLQYQTDKGAEVGRLIGALGRLGKCMSGIPDEDATTNAPAEDGANTTTAATAPAADNDEMAVDDIPADETETGKPSGHQRQKKSVSFAEGPPQVQKAPQAQQQGSSGGGGGGKKKKKGKK